jgi:hypothetical protein
VSTNSLFNNIKVKDKKFCRALVDAMETSKASKEKEVVFSRKVENLDSEKIKTIFGAKR